MRSSIKWTGSILSATAALATAACSSAPETGEPMSMQIPTAHGVVTPLNGGGGGGGVGTPPAPPPAPASAPPNLQYGGGPVIGNAHIVSVNWGPVNPAVKAAMPDFYSSLLGSDYMTLLSQYSTPTQTIGNGVLQSVRQILPDHGGTLLSDADIQAELIAQIDDYGVLEQPTGNTLYVVHFPPGVRIVTKEGGLSCVANCGFHGATKTRTLRDLFYVVLPDLSSLGCESACGAAPLLDNYTASATHEIAEAITDPQGGNGWAERTYAIEVGDICTSNRASVTMSGHRYTVQMAWSNRDHACSTGTQGFHPTGAPGCAKDIGVGSGASAWVLGCGSAEDTQVYQWMGSYWDGRPGWAKHIAVSPEGIPWVVTASGATYKWNTSTRAFDLHPAGGCARAISVGRNDDAWVVGCGPRADETIYRLVGGSWRAMPGVGAQVSVSPSGGANIVSSTGTPSWWDGSSFNVYSGCVTSLGVSDVEQYAIGCGAAGDKGVFEYRQFLSTWDLVPGMATKIAVSAEGTPWAITASGAIYRGNDAL